MNKAIFIDKDGTLIENVSYNKNPTKISLLPGSGKGLRMFKEAGFKIIVVTNQSGIAKGLLTKEDINSSELRIKTLLKPFRATLDGFYFCPHSVDGTVVEYSFQCYCRKPFPGMLYQAAQELSIDLKKSWMIGDISTDIEAGRAAGCKTVFINNSYAKEKPFPDIFADNIFYAASFIIPESQHSSRNNYYAKQ